MSFVFLGVIAGMGMTIAFADDQAPASSAACTTSSIPGTLTPTYDNAGHLVAIEDHVNRAHARLSYAGSALDDITLTHFIKNRAKPDHYGSTEVWGPTLWAEYNKATGKLAVVHTYEKGWQLTYTLPRDLDFETLRDPRDHKVRFTGAPERCDSFYEKCTALPERTIELPEPLLAKSDSCIAFGGASFALNQNAQTVAPQNIQTQTTEPKRVAPIQEQPTLSGGHNVCVDGLCIFVHDDEAAGRVDAE